MERIKKDFESLAEEAIDNIRSDRQKTEELLKDLVKYIATDEHRHNLKKLSTGITLFFQRMRKNFLKSFYMIPINL
jgi:hypothetical protein